MKIVADKDIFRVADYFADAGELVLLPGRDITADDVRDADALLVRTVTRVDENLVAGSSLTFIGSATSGIDHVDQHCLEQRGIHFSHAAGCNAMAVVNYVLAALAWLSERREEDWRRWSVGIVGAGNVGGRLARVLEALGMDFCIHDPLLDESHPLSPQFVSLEQVLRQDVLTLHTPLTATGPYPTKHLLDSDRLEMLGGGAILVNAARGEVVDNLALEQILERRQGISVVLDVWEHEPRILPGLLDKVAIGTPHIAGYSQNGKLNGTQWIYEAFCEHFARQMVIPDPAEKRAVLQISQDMTGYRFLNQAILEAYPIHNDFLVRAGSSIVDALGHDFDRLRNSYAFRREFSDCQVDDNRVPDDLKPAMQALGFVQV